MMNAKERSRDLAVEVVEILGSCPVYRLGDRFNIIEGHKLVSGQPICMHVLQALSPYYVALGWGIEPEDLDLAGSDGAAHVQCPDPQRYTGGGTVTFRIAPLEEGA